MAIFQSILSNISNLMISVHMGGLDSDVTLVELDFKPQSTHWNQFTELKTSKTHSARNLPLF